MFHYGIAGWSMYSLLGMAMGYFAYRWGMPLSIRAALYPLLGKRVRGTAGNVIDIFALVGTVVGVATSMGIGVVLLNVGFSWLFGLPQSLALQIALVLVAVVMTIAACTSGVDKGIRLISELNLWSAGAMLLYILVTGQTPFLLNAIVESIGRFVWTLPTRPCRPWPMSPAAPNGWPGPPCSGAMVMSNFSSTIPDPGQDGAKWLRIFWAVLTAMLTIAMLLAGGVTTMEYATLIFALPVTIVAYLVKASFSKALRMERADREGRVLRRADVSAHGGLAPEKSWRQRLGSLRSYPSTRAVAHFATETVGPALETVAAEFRAQSYVGEITSSVQETTGIAVHSLVIRMGQERDFMYRIAPVEAPVPNFGARVAQDRETFYRLEVFTQTGSEGYSVMGLTRQQIINDVLDRYEGPVGYLSYAQAISTASVLTPRAAATVAVESS